MPSQRDRRNYTEKQEKKRNFATNPHTQNVHEKYTGGGLQDKNGFHNFILSASQKKCIEVVENNTLSFVKGPAGVGKTAAALFYAVQRYIKEPFMKIIVIRTPVESGSDKIGFLPSDLAEKIAPHFSSAKNILELLLTPQKVDADLNGPNKRLQFLIPNYALGNTFDNSIIIIDEAQMIQPLILKLLLERTGKNSKVIVLGDPTQLYVADKSRNGLSDALDRFFTKGEEEGNAVLVPKWDEIGYYQYSIDDMMRSDIVKTIITAYATI